MLTLCPITRSKIKYSGRCSTLSFIPHLQTGGILSATISASDIFSHLIQGRKRRGGVGEDDAVQETTQRESWHGTKLSDGGGSLTQDPVTTSFLFSVLGWCHTDNCVKLPADILDTVFFDWAEI